MAEDKEALESMTPLIGNDSGDYNYSANERTTDLKKLIEQQRIKSSSQDTTNIWSSCCWRGCCCSTWL